MIKKRVTFVHVSNGEMPELEKLNVAIKSVCDGKPPWFGWATPAMPVDAILAVGSEPLTPVQVEAGLKEYRAMGYYDAVVELDERI